VATVDFNLAGLVIILDHADATALVNAGPNIGAAVGGALTPALTAASVAAPLAAAITAAVIGYFKVQSALVAAVDRGNGVYLTLPWPAIYFGQIWLIIPTTRPAIGLGAGWALVNQGQFRTEDSADLVTYQVENGAVGADVVEFRLVIGNNSSGWAKVIIMPDGQGSRWEIKAEGRGNSAQNGLWANQVNNGQSLTFRKPKAFGIWYSVVDIGYLNDLRGGDRVTFVWEQD
jgi:hypothetical protein